MIDLFTPKGHKVKVTKETANNGYESQKEQVAKLLELEKEYTVDRTDVNDFSSTVYLQEFPNEPFNTVNFENVTEVNPGEMKSHPDYKRYHNQIDNMADTKTVINEEVEVTLNLKVKFTQASYYGQRSEQQLNAEIAQAKENIKDRLLEMVLDEFYSQEGLSDGKQGYVNFNYEVVNAEQ